MLLRCWFESSQRNKVLKVLRIQIQNTFRKKTKHRYNIFTMHSELNKSFSLAIYSPCHKYDPRRDVLS